jgi:hypothetical protein
MAEFVNVNLSTSRGGSLHMNDELSTLTRVEVREGVVVRIETASLGGDREKVGIQDYVPFNDVMEGIEAVADSFSQSLKRIRPSKAAVEFGVEVGLEAGKLVAMIGKVSGKANFKVTLEWSQKETAPASAP